MRRRAAWAVVMGMAFAVVLTGCPGGGNATGWGSGTIFRTLTKPDGSGQTYTATDSHNINFEVFNLAPAQGCVRGRVSAVYPVVGEFGVPTQAMDVCTDMPKLGTGYSFAPVNTWKLTICKLDKGVESTCTVIATMDV
ncbi:MAG: hypothetical protein U0V73_00180 [Acidimicrobiia bacterium]